MRAVISDRWTRRLCSLGACVVLLAAGGCATAWKDTGSFYRATQTIAQIESVPNGRAYIDNRYVGETPVEAPLQYEQEMIRRERKVSYWITQPGWSLLLTIGSLGIYLPFSIIPVDNQTTLEAQQNFRGNEFNLSVSSPGCADWHQLLRLTGEQEIHVRAELQKEGEAE